MATFVLAVAGTNHGQVPGGWFLDPEMSGGGAVMDHTVRVADALRWMLGAEAKSVYAEAGSFFGSGRIDDGAILTLQLEGGPVGDGAFATIDPSWSRGDVTFGVTGTSGVLDVDAFAERLTSFEHASGGVSWMHTGEDMNASMLDAISCGASPMAGRCQRPGRAQGPGGSARRVSLRYGPRTAAAGTGFPLAPTGPGASAALIPGTRARVLEGQGHGDRRTHFPASSGASRKRNLCRTGETPTSGNAKTARGRK